MFRYKLLAAAFSFFVAFAEELTLFSAESPKPDITQNENKILEWPPQDESEEVEIASLPATYTVSASVYFPEPNQTQGDPLETADGSRINKKNPKKHRWIAVSRDLHSRWGGHIQFGDSVWVSGISDELDGVYVVRDTMNKRIKNRIDILLGRKDGIMGFWNEVQIAKLD
jgi:3D (Asp-Asp-Asp) domain-containing protein